ncbi:hypothetical protein BABINDRAFT_6911 [Babjeviella inositovora NRRL Y-12698]|uniref:Uncharacterized protein n=1 Tax=Babjeviella inositovora NRRL Y-12698 TaxID=984486 RepID=A0A1E3QTS5_9ASCO|nr:uncharacterized protein BABINDRAFT_6911 [Babjeviella inositovora NRRL Y-12698]ODQ81069.1 hypothetical protein BABINDRAFT_6911 [Babjeviella inositovora NRRL Y-12698]
MVYISGDPHTPPSTQKLVREEGVVSPLELLSSKLLQTLSHLSHVYHQIGYDKNSIRLHQENIFKDLHLMLKTHIDESEREKVTLQGECKWLKEQIKILLIICDDKRGDKTLNQNEQTNVFKVDCMALAEYKHITLLELKIQLNKCYFKVLLQFNELYLNLSNLNITAKRLLAQIHDPSYQFHHRELMGNMPSMEESQKFLQLYTSFKELYYALFDTGEDLMDQTCDQSEIFNQINSISTSPRRTLTQKRCSVNYSNSSLFQLESTDHPKTNLCQSSPDHPTIARLLDQSTDHPMVSGLFQCENPNTASDQIVMALQKLNFELIKLVKSANIIRLSQENIQTLEQEVKLLKHTLESRSQKLLGSLDTISEITSAMELSPSDLQSLLQSLLNGETLPEISCMRSLPVEHLRFTPLLEELVGVLNTRKNIIQKEKHDLLSQIHPLWQKLKQDQSYIQGFLERNTRANESTVKTLRNELDRLVALRAQYMKEFIEDVRVKIETTWGLLSYSPEEKAEWEYHNKSFECTEGVLETFEKYLQSLEHQYQKLKPLLLLIKQFEDLMNEKYQLEESSKDSSRLLSKGSSTILLTEERTRKKVARNLPRLIASLKEKLCNYKEETGKDFAHDGTSYLNTVLENTPQTRQMASRSLNITTPRPSSANRPMWGSSHTAPLSTIKKPVFQTTSAIRKPPTNSGPRINLSAVRQAFQPSMRKPLTKMSMNSPSVSPIRRGTGEKNRITSMLPSIKVTRRLEKENIDTGYKNTLHNIGEVAKNKMVLQPCPPPAIAKRSQLPVSDKDDSPFIDRQSNLNLYDSTYKSNGNKIQTSINNLADESVMSSDIGEADYETWKNEKLNNFTDELSPGCHFDSALIHQDVI